MNREETKQFCLKAVRALLFASLFSPLIIAAGFYFPYIVPKTIFFQLVVEAALFFYILLVSLDKKYAPKFDMCARSLCAFFAVSVFAAALGASPARSFLGTYERMLSVVGFAHFLAFFFMARAVFTRKDEWRAFFRVFLFVAALASIYGIAQKLGVPWTYHPGIDRIDSTIGNAAFFAGYLIFALFFALILAIEDARPEFRLGYVSLASLFCAMIYLTGTRGAALGLAVGAIFLIAAHFFRPAASDMRVKKYVSGGVAAVVMAAGMIMLLEQKSGGISQSMRRFTSVSLSDSTVRTRILSARTSWEGFRARPLLGFGPENYNLVFDKYYNPKLYPTENWFDHAHNIFFDVLTTTGVIGFAAYFFFLACLLHALCRGARSAAEAYWPRMLLCALFIAYFVQNIFVFDSLATLLPFFMLCAYAGAGFMLEKNEVLSEKKEKEKVFSNPALGFAVWLLPLFLLGAYWINIRPARAAQYAVRALQTDKKDSGRAREYFTRALAFSNFGRHEIRGKLADFTSAALVDERDTDREAKKDIAEYTLAEMERSVEEDPLNFRNYLYLANYLSGNDAALASFGIDALARADATLARAEALAPFKPLLFVQWGRVKSQKKEYAQAVALFARAVALNPAVVDSQLRLASAYRLAGDTEKAVNLYREISGNKEKLNAEAYVDIAVGFANAGKPEEAVAAAENAAALNPSLREASERFIAEMRAQKSQ